ncbi:MAG: hypothetical protein MUF72_17245 [Elainella sp. Prado103]|nr:hypothetical protein [Elainella sp. Prado103]
MYCCRGVYRFGWIEVHLGVLGGLVDSLKDPLLKGGALPETTVAVWAIGFVELE